MDDTQRMQAEAFEKGCRYGMNRQHQLKVWEESGRKRIPDKYLNPYDPEDTLIEESRAVAAAADTITEQDRDELIRTLGEIRRRI